MEIKAGCLQLVVVHDGVPSLLLTEKRSGFGLTVAVFPVVAVAKKVVFVSESFSWDRLVRSIRLVLWLLQRN